MPAVRRPAEQIAAAKKTPAVPSRPARKSASMGPAGTWGPGPVSLPVSASPAVAYPKLLRVRQTFERPVVPDVPAAVRAALEPLDLGRTVRRGQTVALTAGSR